MPKKKYAIIFISFAAVLVVMLVLPFVLFKIKDYSILNRTKFEDIESLSDDFFNTEPLSTGESMALLCKDISDNADVIVIDNTAAKDAQSDRIFYDVCEEIAKMQEQGAFPVVDITEFNMVKFDVWTYVDISDTRRYVKVASVAGSKGTSMFEAAMDLETHQIYYYSLRHPVITQKTDVELLLNRFVDYLGIEGYVWYDSDSPYSDSDGNAQYEYEMPPEKTWFITSDIDVNLMCFHFGETISIVLRPNSE